jgi:NAD(P)-dependent dehydrogenase (short-subunit alcohol dehydrogenase family)
MPCQKWTTGDIPDQTNKVALVTGATGGLGYETSIALAKAGATVILAGRNEEKGKEALARIRAECPNAKIEFGKVDLGSLKSIKDFAADISTKYASLDILINNAGVMTPPKRETTADGFEIQFGTNHLSHFALTAQLLPLLRKSRFAPARVVTVSSLAARNGKINFDDLQSEKGKYGWNVYDQSKLANLLFTFELQRKSDANGWGIMSLAAHPGLASTDLVANGMGEKSWMGWTLTNVLKPLLWQSGAQGALPQLYAATSPDAQKSGYYGPNGFHEMKGHPTDAHIVPAALDLNVAAKLWDVSTDLTGVTWP